MSFSSKHAEKLSQDEWNEMTALKDAINHDISQVAPQKMEAFTEYLVRSLREKGGWITVTTTLRRIKMVLWLLKKSKNDENQTTSY